ncbi:MarR family winged helix-turn-helix transcriptional regulator [Tsukamurella soli]|uniref:HTH marR-type domain-containing protein n=1 Tax=Tsukamurella soli TaxID=644556 RepID=A0ABP8JGD6_9ACTN
MDSVGRELPDWLARMPSADTDPDVEALRQRIGRLARQFERVLDEVAEAQGLSRGDWTALSVLVRAGRPVTPSELMQTLALTSGTVSTRLKRLTEAGLIGPATADGDARSRPVTMTERGRARWAAATAERTRRERDLVLPALAGRIDGLNDGLATLLGALEDRLGRSGDHDLPR